MDAMVVPGLVTGLALLLAGALKIGRRDRLLVAFADLRVPSALSRPFVVRTLPAAEVVLGGAVLVVPAPAALVPAVLAAALLATYAAVVGRVVLRGEEVSCACFGAVEPVGTRTLLRNLLLVLAAVLTVVDAARGNDVLARLGALEADGWAWVVAVLAVGGLVALVAPRSRPPAARGEGPGEGPEPAWPPVRGIPYLEVRHPDGVTTTLPELAHLRPQLLVHLSRSCRHCDAVAEALPGWGDRLPQVDLRVLTSAPPGDDVPAAWPGVLHDPEQRVATVLGLVRPSAVLLGADALVAAGPVHGPDAILDLLVEMEESLQG